MSKSTEYLYQWLEIDKRQFIKNVKILQTHIHPEIAAVVKGNAYGHDLMTAVELFKEAGIKRFCTYHPHHALTLKMKYPEYQVIAMGPVRMDQVGEMVEAGVELYVWDLPFMDHLLSESKHWSSVAQIHLEAETGMYRTGLPLKKIPALLEKIEKAPKLEIKGICTHFSGADEKDNLDRVQDQFEKWRELKETVKTYINREIEWHGANSSAGIMLPEDSFTFARLGLLLYGFFPAEYSKNIWPEDIEAPSPAITLKGRTSGRNVIPENGYTGYGKTWKAEEDTDSMIIPIGYSDGLPRALSHHWSVKMNSDPLPILGRINMNLTIVQSPPEQTGTQNEIVLIDSNPPFDWYEASEVSGRFIYELLTLLSPEIPRVVK